MPPTLDDALRAADDPEVRDPVVGLLLDLLRVDTTVGPGLERVREHEERVLALIAQAAEQFLGSASGIDLVPIDPRIEADPYYTPVHYTKTAARPEGLGAADAYRGRSNLVVRVPGQGRGTLAFNAHIDVVQPYIAPRLDGGVVYGRGACDDKGQCIVMLLALCLIEHARWMCGLVPPADLLFEFAIDEEPGGNGSLSLALDRRFAFDAMVVLEATKLAVHPGNRGAVWYRIELDARGAEQMTAEMVVTDLARSVTSDGAPTGTIDLVGLAAAVVLALEEEGAKLKAESGHPLFPHRPVQTCHGILGPWGKHPSAVNDHVELLFSAPREQLGSVIDQAVAAYCAAYGDKTREADPSTGQPKVDHHYDLAPEGDAWRLVVHGKAGHMGAILQCDDAITKAAYIVRALEAELGIRRLSLGCGGMDGGMDEWMDDREESRKLPARSSIHPPIQSSIHPPTRSPAPLVLEGGQGFLPTHSLDEVTKRMRRAMAAGAGAYCRKRGVSFGPHLATMTFDKLHNDAFARDPASPAVRAFVEAVRAAGIEVPEPLRGWDVSCDARIFAREYPESAIITFGAGALEHAHSAQEQVKVDDIVAAAKAVARFALTFEPEASGE